MDKKVIYSILRELQKGEEEPRSEHFDMDPFVFADTVEMMEHEGLIKGSARAGKTKVVWLNSAKVTLKGIK